MKMTRKTDPALRWSWRQRLFLYRQRREAWQQVCGAHGWNDEETQARVVRALHLWADGAISDEELDERLGR